MNQRAMFALSSLCRMSPRAANRSAAGAHRHVDRHRQGPTGWGPTGRAGHPQLAGSHRRTREFGDQRERAASISGAASRTLHTRNTDGRFCPVSRRGDRVGAGGDDRTFVVLAVSGIAVAIDVEGGSRIEARGSGFETRFGPDYIKNIPGRRFSLFDLVKVAPGVSPTSVGNSTGNTRVGPGLRRQRERVPARWHQFHLSLQRRRGGRTRHRRHSGSAGSDGGGVRRIRQHPGRRLQRDHEAGGQRLSLRRIVLLAGRRPHRPAHRASCSARDPTGERLRARRIP